MLHAPKRVLLNERPITTHDSGSTTLLSSRPVFRESFRKAGNRGRNWEINRKETKKRNAGVRNRDGKCALCNLPPPATPTRSSRARGLRGCIHSVAVVLSFRFPTTTPRGGKPAEGAKSAALAVHADATLADRSPVISGSPLAVPPTERSQAVRLNLSYGLSIPHG